MSGIKIFVRNNDEKANLIDSYLEPDNQYLEAIDRLRDEMIKQGIDVTAPEGRKALILAVRKLNRTFCIHPDKADSCLVRKS